MSEGIRELKEKAQALLAKRQHRKALEIFERVVELASDDVFAVKKIAEIYDTLGENEKAAARYVRLSALLDKDGRRLQAIASCKLALASFPSDAAAQSLLKTFYEANSSPLPAFSLNQQALARGPVAPPHAVTQAGAPPPIPASTAQTEPLHVDPSLSAGASTDAISPAVAKHVETFVGALVELCATFGSTVLSAQTQSLADSISGNTDFLWLIQFSGEAEHVVVVSAQRRFVLGLTKRVLDIDDDMATDAMATKLSSKLIGMYVDDVKRAFATKGKAVSSGQPLPVTGANATYQMRGTRALHVPLSSEIGWVQLTIAGGL